MNRSVLSIEASVAGPSLEEAEPPRASSRRALLARGFRWSALAAACALVVAALVPGSAAAQSPLQQVLDLNRQGMAAYQNLELEQASELLNRALQLAQRRNVTGAPLARTHLNLGVLAVGGMGDNGQGLTHFVAALRADPNVQLDPLTSTPEIETVFRLAQQQSGRGGTSGSTGGNAGNSSGGGNASTGNAGSSGGGGGLEHVAVPEQLVSTPVPVYIEVPGDPAHVYLFYRGHGMREFRRVEMVSVADGYGFEIPCSDVFEPAIEYYIVAFAGDGSPMGFAGTQGDPIRVSIVGSRTQPAPALPGRAPPEQCRDEECPPGMEGCEAQRGSTGMGGTCRATSECAAGLVCEDEFCVAGDGSSSGGGGGGGSGADFPRFFVQLGGTLGLGFASSGMRADSIPCPAGTPDCNENNVDAFVDGLDPSCNAGDGYYCVRVAQGGFVPVGALRLNIGYYILDWLGLAVFARLQPVAGQGALSFLLIGGRAQFQLTNPAPTGLHAHAFVGGGGGQVQIQPPGNGDNAPWIISGFGNISVGGSLGYRFVRNFGLFAQLDLMFQFPTFMFVMDISGGVEVAF